MSYVLSVLMFLVAANAAVAGYYGFDDDIDQPGIGVLLFVCAAMLVIAGVKLWP